MQWEFRKTLDNFESYKANSQTFIGEVYRGDPGVLNTLVREMELIISDPKEKIPSKVLAMRFARDIMILGKTDVVQALTKLVPHMLKVCSHRVQSDDPDRGETIFQNHPAYETATEQEKRNLQTLGSTYFTLNLESILHWAKWVPCDENGNQSIYSKGYNSLLERGVTFQPIFHYYKNSDTDKFKDTYRVQFFEEQSVDLASKTSRVSNSSNRFGTDLKDSGSIYFNTVNFDNIQKIKNYLYSIENDKKNRFQKLQQLNKVVSDLHQNKSKSRDKTDRKWLENYMISFNLLTSKKIDYSTFMKRMMTEDLEIYQKDEAQISGISKHSMDNGAFKKNKATTKRQPNSRGQIRSQSSEKEVYEDLLKKQEQSYTRKIDSLRQDIKDLQKQLGSQKLHFQAQKAQIIRNYDDRISLIKRGIVQSGSQKTEFLLKENDRLKQKIHELEKQSKLNNREKLSEEQLEHLQTKIEGLMIQNQKLKKHLRNNDLQQQNGQLIRKVKELQRQLKNINKQKSECSRADNSQQLNKKNKQISNLSQELKLYKQELSNQRQRTNKQKKNLEAKVDQLSLHNKQLKQNNLFLQKKLDLRDIEATELAQQVRLFKMMDKETNMMMKNFVSPKQKKGEDIEMIGSEIHSNAAKSPKAYAYQYRKYEKLRNRFKNEKERYLRFCRCCLKKKDLLLKQNQFEVGLISQVISDRQLKFILHFTNMSEDQVQNLEMCVQAPQYIRAQLATQFVFCIQRQQQEKITLKCSFSEGNFLSCFRDFYYPIVVRFSYKKLDRAYSYELPVPFVLYKTMQIYKFDSMGKALLNQKQSLSLTYSKKLLPDLKYLSSYFPLIEETYRNKFECQLFERSSKLKANVSFEFFDNNSLVIQVQPLGKDRLDGPQREVMEDLMGFLEFCFRK